MMEEINELIAQRRLKLEKLRSAGINPYPNDFTPDICSQDIFDKFDAIDEHELKTVSNEFSLAGRLMSKRIMGKASFIHIHDRKGKIQIYVKRDEVGESSYKEFKKYDKY